MGLPTLVLTAGGVTQWRDLLASEGMVVVLDEAEIRRVSELGEEFESSDHPTRPTVYPYLIKRDDVVVRCLETTRRDDVVGLTLLNPTCRKEAELLDALRRRLVLSGAVAEE